MTLLTDGNSNTHHVHAYAVSYTGAEAWGVFEWIVQNPENEWTTFSEDAYPAQSASFTGDPFGAACDLLVPGLSAQGMLCGGGMLAARRILRNAFGWGGRAFAGASIPCVGFTWGWAPCVSGSFTGGFTYGIVWETKTWYDACTGSAFGPSPRGDHGELADHRGWMVQHGRVHLG